MYYHDPFTVVASFLPPAILVCLVVQLVLYLLGSAGLYAMANNTGMKNPWTAWIPIARDHLLGSLADRYNCSCRQKKSMLNVWLTVLSAISLPLSVLSVVLTLILLPLFFNLASPLAAMVLYLFSLLLSVVGIAYKVFYLFSFYYLMMDYEPSRAVLYTILAFFNLGFIPLLLCRHNVPVGVAGRCEPLQPKYNIH